ncbi:hypothetical protein BT69DRAFT_774461 [Atractiella rhizophila]|nr:hypothetical protein BT69DRAFT_1358546 [Atractiella rhizophila]KAH8927515.1 hypothetical protein BT69DRAFT_774461 [Atractiella rhizophila]
MEAPSPLLLWPLDAGHGYDGTVLIGGGQRFRLPDGYSIVVKRPIEIIDLTHESSDNEELGINKPESLKMCPKKRKRVATSGKNSEEGCETRKQGCNRTFTRSCHFSPEPNVPTSVADPHPLELSNAHIFSTTSPTQEYVSGAVTLEDSFARSRIRCSPPHSKTSTFDVPDSRTDSTFLSSHRNYSSSRGLRSIPNTCPTHTVPFSLLPIAHRPRHSPDVVDEHIDSARRDMVHQEDHDQILVGSGGRKDTLPCFGLERIQSSEEMPRSDAVKTPRHKSAAHGLIVIEEDGHTWVGYQDRWFKKDPWLSLEWYRKRLVQQRPTTGSLPRRRNRPKEVLNEESSGDDNEYTSTDGESGEHSERRESDDEPME